MAFGVEGVSVRGLVVDAESDPQVALVEQIDTEVGS
jgi:hypothetical protein